MHWHSSIRSIKFPSSISHPIIITPFCVCVCVVRDVSVSVVPCHNFACRVRATHSTAPQHNNTQIYYTNWEQPQPARKISEILFSAYAAEMGADDYWFYIYLEEMLYIQLYAKQGDWHSHTRNYNPAQFPLALRFVCAYILFLSSSTQIAFVCISNATHTLAHTLAVHHTNATGDYWPYSNPFALSVQCLHSHIVCTLLATPI